MKPASQPKKKIVVGISGGMNSAVTAALLQSQGFQVQGVYVQVVDEGAPPSSAPRFAGRCCLTKKLSVAREVCRKLDIPLQVMRAEGQFEAQVVDHFVHSLLQGQQPNPCAPCQLSIRIGTLLAKADELGCEQVATGHHAQILRDAVGTGGNTSARLQRAVNSSKDQSYFLFDLTQAQLSRLVFPLGGFQDTMISRLAAEFGLPTASAGTPQEICLSTGNGHLPFFESRVAESLRPGGNIKMADGSILGEHRGLYSYRVGQKGLKLAQHIKDPEKYVVTGLDVPGHALMVGSERDLLHSRAIATQASWIRPVDGLRGMQVMARFSPSQAEAVSCRVTHFENRLIRVELEKPAPGLIAGAAIVFYDGDEVLGGAWISSVDSFR